MYEAWKKKMFKARRKLYFKLSLIKKKSNQKKIKPKHTYGKSEIQLKRMFNIDYLFPRKQLRKNKFK